MRVSRASRNTWSNCASRRFASIRRRGELRVFKEDDRELRDVRWIVFEVHVPSEDLVNFVELTHRWSDESHSVCPSTLIHHFILSVRTAKP